MNTLFLVMEQCEDYQQALVVRTGKGYPPGGILDWGDDGEPRALFADRKTAREAIIRTEHYRLAFGTNHPEKKFCAVIPARAVP